LITLFVFDLNVYLITLKYMTVELFFTKCYIMPASHWSHSIVLCAENAPTHLPLLCQWVQNGRKR